MYKMKQDMQRERVGVQGFYRRRSGEPVSGGGACHQGAGWSRRLFGSRTGRVAGALRGEVVDMGDSAEDWVGSAVPRLEDAAW